MKFLYIFSILNDCVNRMASEGMNFYRYYLVSLQSDDGFIHDNKKTIMVFELIFFLKIIKISQKITNSLLYD